MAEREVYTVDEVATKLGLSTWATYEAIKRGNIPVVRIGRRIIIPRPAFDRMMLEGHRAA